MDFKRLLTAGDTVDAALTHVLIVRDSASRSNNRICRAGFGKIADFEFNCKGEAWLVNLIAG